jgi:hypothetical protein
MKSIALFPLIGLMLLVLPGYSQDARSQQFGSLFDGEVNSHDELIKQGWIYLFDSRIPSENQAVKGDPLAMWRPRRADRNNCWITGKDHDEDQERILMNILREGMHGTDLISNMEFRDFDLHVEFRSAENSGIYLRGRYEVQINKAPASNAELTYGDLGGIYAVSPPRLNGGKGPDEWQTFDIRIRGYEISVYLNGVLIQDKLLIPEGKRRIGTGTELGCWPSDGFHNDPTLPGPILIQGNHGQIDLKNIRIRPVSAK